MPPETTERCCRCALCNVQTTLYHAIETGWAPDHYEDDRQGGPVCPQCLETHCRFNEEEGDYERILR